MRFFSRKANSYKILSKLKLGDVYIDCGANTGAEIEIARHSGATIYAFEPNPYAFEVLKEKFAEYENVHLYNYAVLDTNTEMKLFLHHENEEDRIKWSHASSLISEKINLSKDNYIMAKVIDLCQFINEKKIKKIRFIKIDIEGAEYNLVNHLIDKQIHLITGDIYVETHSDKIPQLKQEDNNLKEKNQKRKDKKRTSKLGLKKYSKQ